MNYFLLVILQSIIPEINRFLIFWNNRFSKKSILDDQGHNLNFSDYKLGVALIFLIQPTLFYSAPSTIIAVLC